MKPLNNALKCKINNLKYYILNQSTEAEEIAPQKTIQTKPSGIETAGASIEKSQDSTEKKGSGAKKTALIAGISSLVGALTGGVASYFTPLTDSNFRKWLNDINSPTDTFYLKHPEDGITYLITKNHLLASDGADKTPTSHFIKAKVTIPSKKDGDITFTAAEQATDKAMRMLVAQLDVKHPLSQVINEEGYLDTNPCRISFVRRPLNINGNEVVSSLISVYSSDNRTFSFDVDHNHQLSLNPNGSSPLESRIMAALQETLDLPKMTSALTEIKPKTNEEILTFAKGIRAKNWGIIAAIAGGTAVVGGLIGLGVYQLLPKENK